MYLLDDPAFLLHMIFTATIRTFFLPYRVKTAATTRTGNGCDGKSRCFLFFHISAKCNINAVTALFHFSMLLVMVYPPGPHRHVHNISLHADSIQTDPIRISHFQNVRKKVARAHLHGNRQAPPVFRLIPPYAQVKQAVLQICQKKNFCHSAALCF